MKKLLLAALWLPLMAHAQSYPSPTYNNVTVQGTLTGKVNSTGSTITNATITGGTISGLSSPLPVASGGTNSASASGTALDNITGFSGTGFMSRTGAGAYSFTASTGSGSVVLGTSPSIATPTITGSFTATGLVTLADLATQAANTVLANATGSSASPTAFSMPSCSSATNALQWTSGTGFACNSSINAATLGGATFASPGSIGSTTPGSAAFTTLSSTSAPTLGAATFYPTVATNAALQALSTVTTSTVTRLGFYAAGDTEPLIYTASGSACSLNSGNGDNGSQVKSANSLCWIANFPASGRNVKAFGAKGDSSTDDTTAIQAAINSLPSGGGTILFPPAVYRISTTLNIGNGTTSSVSTTNGVKLVGQGQIEPSFGFFTGYGSVGQSVALTWTGANTVPMIKINGPMQGWGLTNLYLDGQGSATYGLYITSGQFGLVENFSVGGCSAGEIYSTSVPLFGSLTVTDAFRNTFNHVNVLLPSSGAVQGVTLAGQNGGSNTSYAVFRDLSINMNGNTSAYGLYLQNTDSDQFFGLQIFNDGGAAKPVTFDYSQVTGSVWPASIGLYGLDFGNNATPFTNVGTPGSGARPNVVVNVGETNGMQYPTTIPNVNTGLPLVVTQKNLAGQTAALTSQPLFTTFVAGMYRISYYLVVTTAGTGGTIQPSVVWNDGTGNQTAFGTGANANTVGSYSLGTVDAYVASGQNVQYQAGFNTVTGSPAYRLVVTAERLN